LTDFSIFNIVYLIRNNIGTPASTSEYEEL